MAQPSIQWANRSSHGQLPPVSFLSVENWCKYFIFIRVMQTSTLQLSKCPTQYPSSHHHPGSWHHDQHQQIKASWMDNPFTIPTWWPYQRGRRWMHRTFSLHQRHTKNVMGDILWKLLCPVNYCMSTSKDTIWPCWLNLIWHNIEDTNIYFTNINNHIIMI